MNKETKQRLDELMTELAKMYVKAEELFIKIEREMSYGKKETFTQNT